MGYPDPYFCLCAFLGPYSGNEESASQGTRHGGGRQHPKGPKDQIIRYLDLG